MAGIVFKILYILPDLNLMTTYEIDMIITHSRMWRNWGTEELVNFPKFFFLFFFI